MVLYKEFIGPKNVCDWINNSIFSKIIGITQHQDVFTVFYEPYGEEDFLRDMAAIDCDLEFALPENDMVRLTKSARSIHEGSKPRPVQVY